MTTTGAVQTRRFDGPATCFLESDNRFGCAEATLVALKEAFGLPDAADSSPAMALNGGYAYSGGTCGALSGGGLAVGQLAERRLRDHRLAKTMTRSVVQTLLDDFVDEFGSANCRDLLGMDLRAPGAHDAFIASGDLAGRLHAADRVRGAPSCAARVHVGLARSGVEAVGHQSVDPAEVARDRVAGPEEAR